VTVPIETCDLTPEQRGKALRNLVVRVAATAVHSAHQLVRLQEVLPVMAAELADPIGVPHDFGTGLASPHGPPIAP